MTKREAQEMAETFGTTEENILELFNAEAIRLPQEFLFDQTHSPIWALYASVPGVQGERKRMEDLPGGSLIIHGSETSPLPTYFGLFKDEDATSRELPPGTYLTPTAWNHSPMADFSTITYVRLSYAGRLWLWELVKLSNPQVRAVQEMAQALGTDSLNPQQREDEK